MESEELPAYIARRIQELCREKGITPYGLAIRSEVHPSTLYRILNMKNTNHSITTITKISMALGISLKEFWK